MTNFDTFWPITYVHIQLLSACFLHHLISTVITVYQGNANWRAVVIAMCDKRDVYYHINDGILCLLNAKLHYTATGCGHVVQHHNGRTHNNSTTCCATNLPPTDKNLLLPNILTCQDVELWHCDVANLLYNKL